MQNFFRKETILSNLTGRLRLACVLSCLLLVGSCASSINVVAPVSPSSSAITIRSNSPCMLMMPCLNQTYTFARLADNGEILSDELYQTTVVFSNQFYLLNAEPGQYVAVAVSYSRSINSSVTSGNVQTNVSANFSENIMFSEEMVKQSLVTVRSGELAVMGDFTMDIKGRMAMMPSAAQFLKEADETQVHYAKTLDPELEERGVTSPVKYYRGTYKSSEKDAATIEELLENAYKHIGSYGWDRRITE